MFFIEFFFEKKVQNKNDNTNTKVPKAWQWENVIIIFHPGM